MFNWMSLAFQAALAATPAPAVSNMLSVEGCEFGEVYSTTSATCDISFSNLGDIPIHIRNFAVISGAGSATRSELTLAPHATSSVRMQVDTGKTAGRASYIVVFDSDPRSERRSTKVRGFVLSALDQAAPKLDLGVVDLAAPPVMHSLLLSSREVTGFRIIKVLDAPDWLSAAISPDGRTLQVRVREDALWGLKEDYVRIALNTPRQKEAWVKVKADIHGDVVPSVNPLDIGVVRVGNRNEAIVRVASLSHKKLKLGEMKLEGFKGSAETLPCSPKAEDCVMVRLTVSEKQPTGSLKGTLWIDLPAYKQRLPITTWGFLIPKDYQLQKVGQDAARSEVAVTKPDIATALKNISQPKKKAEAPPPGNGPLLKWSLSNAASVYGFQIFRADSEHGPFLLLNPSPVRSATEGNDSESYQWRDNNAHPGTTYYYSIGILRVNGQKETLAGPQKVVAK